MSIAERLKAARGALGLSQTEAASGSGVPVGTLRKYEQGPSQPGAEAIAGFVRLGINANWLLTGEGPMLRADLAPKPAPKINAEALAVMIEAARMAHPKADPARHAELAARFYALSVENGTVSETDIHPPGMADAA